MRKVMKFFFGIIGNCLRSIWSVTLVIFFSDLRPQIQALPKSSGECFVLGNGPSLSTLLEESLHILNGRSVMCMNDFPQSHWFKKIKPAFYVATDPVYWSETTSERLKQRYREYAETFAKVVTWPLVIFLPVAAKRSNVFDALPSRNVNVTICYVNTTQVTAPSWLSQFLWRKNLAMPTMQTILVAAIYLALNLGFKTVYIAGADNSWHEDIFVDQDNILKVRYARFHEKNNQEAAPFTQDSAERDPYDMSGFFGWLAQIFHGYHELHDYAKNIGSRVLNTSPKSYIDAFSRISLKDVPPSDKS